MLWLESWIECRFRAWICAGLLISYSALALFMTNEQLPGFEGSGGVYLQWSACFLLPLCAVTLAGAGLHAQTTLGAHRGMHPAIFFTLSMPVSRSRRVLTRAAAGWALLLGGAAFTAAASGLIPAFAGGETSAAAAALRFPYLLMGATVFYSIGVALSAVTDEFKAGFTSLFVAGLAGGYGLAGGKGWMNLARYMTAEPLLARGDWMLPQTLAYLTIVIASIGAALFAAGRKEF